MRTVNTSRAPRAAVQSKAVELKVVDRRLPLLKRASALRRRLLAWYDANRRDLPWRETSDPYCIWLSEIMLQQTRVAVVIERYLAFLEKFSSIHALAAASEDDVLALWSGLGYYRRARMLLKAAQQVSSQHDGSIPRSAQQLRELPGIGAYTSAAIASIAFGERVAVVDGNVERVLCRVAGWEGSVKSDRVLRQQVESLAAELVDPFRPGDFNQAMMELGATVCLPRNPLCLSCPLAHDCITRGEHKTAPRKPMKSVDIAHALVVRSVRKRGAAECQVLLERRPDALSVMPGMWELPPLQSHEVPPAVLLTTVRHAIMQVNYTVRIRSVAESEVDDLTASRGTRQWLSLPAAHDLPLTGLARKVLKRAGLFENGASVKRTRQ